MLQPGILGKVDAFSWENQASLKDIAPGRAQSAPHCTTRLDAPEIHP
jgi:hypothetical protein